MNPAHAAVVKNIKNAVVHNIGRLQINGPRHIEIRG